MDDLSKKTTVELVTEYTYLEQEIDMKLFRHEQLRQEILKRYPQVEKSGEFKKKVKKLGELDINGIIWERTDN